MFASLDQHLLRHHRESLAQPESFADRFAQLQPDGHGQRVDPHAPGDRRRSRAACARRPGVPGYRRSSDGLGSG